MASTEPLLPAEQEYFNYSQQDSVHFDVKHLAQALCISDVGDSAVLLLNPMVVWPDGEWEAWFFANWLPGATRYRSFADWMHHELAELRDGEFTHSIIPGELPTVYLDGPVKENRRVRPREVILTLDEVFKKLTSKTRSQRVKATRQLGRIGGDAAISKLIDLLKADYDHHVRCEAAEVLGRMRSKDAIEPLIAVTAEESYVTSTAIQALGNFNDEPSAQRLLKLVEEDGPSAGVAAYALAKRNDSRGVPLLVQRLTSKDWRDQQTGNIAGSFIAEFGKVGFQALEPLVESGEVEIRQRAINGVFNLACLAKDREVKAQARHLLERCFQNETDPAVRQNLEACLAVACNKKSPHLDNPFASE
jgi:HEAT repeat protein